VHAIVVAYRVPEQLDRCLAGLGQELPVTVVDNSSMTEVEAVTRSYGATYVDAGGNLGFAAGVNIALRRLEQGESGDVLLVNPDAVVTPAAVRSLAACLGRPGNERVAAVAPRLVGPSGVEQRVVWPFPTPLRACAEAVGLGRLRSRRMYAIGAVLLLRGEALRDVGLFDTRFFLYAEEADWQRRARGRGWTSALCAEAVAHHVGAATSGDPLLRETLFHAAKETYIRKWYGPAGWWLYRLAACTGAFVRALVLTRERRREARRCALLYLRGPRRCAALRPE
jgi:GT2 family glycosyltransferase